MCAIWVGGGWAVTVDPGEQFVQVGSGEFPLERSGVLVVADLEAAEPGSHFVQVIEVVG